MLLLHLYQTYKRLMMMMMMMMKLCRWLFRNIMQPAAIEVAVHVEVIFH